MSDNRKIKIRCIKDGEWYWIDKTILYFYGRSLKPSGIAVYNALASFANSKTQACFPTQRAIAELIGVSRRTVIRKIKLLIELCLIRVKKIRGRCSYQLLKSTAEAPNEAQRCDKKYISDVKLGNINKNYIKRIINKNIDNTKFSYSEIKAFGRSRPKTREELLALDIAKGLNDIKALPLYLSYAKKYPEFLLRKILGEIKEIPFNKIRKSRGALFNHLIKKYAQKASKNHRN